MGRRRQARGALTVALAASGTARGGAAGRRANRVGAALLTNHPRRNDAAARAPAATYPAEPQTATRESDMAGKGEAGGISAVDGHLAVEASDLEIVRRAAALGFDPARVAIALGVDLGRAGQAGGLPAPTDSHR